MEDRKYYNDEAKALKMDELDSVAGGRGTMRATESKDHILVYERLQDKIRELRGPYRHSAEADALEKRYFEAYDEWITQIKLAPEDGPDILFSDFFKF